MKSLKSSCPSNGQALLEFALGITILLLLLGGIIDISRIYMTYTAVSEGAREGAIYGSTSNNTSDEEITSRVKESSYSPVNLNDNARVQIIICYCQQQNDGTKQCKRANDNIPQHACDPNDTSIAPSSWKCGDLTHLNTIKVTVTYALPLRMPITMAMFGSPINIRATEEAVILSPPCTP